jgi:hypothetical protein
MGAAHHKENGRPGQKVMPSEERRIVYYLRNAEEMSIDEMAEYFKRTKACLMQIARRHGIRRNNRKEREL